jgi:membrane protein required for colicin V production
MNWADYTIIAVIAISALMSLMRGFVSEILSVLIWLVALWVAANFSGLVADNFLQSIEVPSARTGAAYALLFIVVVVLGSLLQWWTKKLIKATGAANTDRTLGLLFGAARGILTVFAAVLLAGFTAFPKDSWWRESQLLPSFASGARMLSGYLPERVKNVLQFPNVTLPILPARVDKPEEADTAESAKPDKTAPVHSEKPTT